jgi:hypothetical protein
LHLKSDEIRYRLHLFLHNIREHLINPNEWNHLKQKLYYLVYYTFLSFLI